MNYSIYSADRTTHLKVVVVALITGVAIAGLGLSSRVNFDAAFTRTAAVAKAGNPLAMSSSDALVTRYNMSQLEGKETGRSHIRGQASQTYQARQKTAWDALALYRFQA
jgi:hypothetical protein